MGELGAHHEGPALLYGPRGRAGLQFCQLVDESLPALAGGDGPLHVTQGPFQLANFVLGIPAGRRWVLAHLGEGTAGPVHQTCFL